MQSTLEDETRARCTKDGCQGLSSLEELDCGNSIALLGVDGHLSKRPLEGIEVGASGGDLNGGHSGFYVDGGGQQEARWFG